MKEENSFNSLGFVKCGIDLFYNQSEQHAWDVERNVTDFLI